MPAALDRRHCALAVFVAVAALAHAANDPEGAAVLFDFVAAPRFSTIERQDADYSASMGLRVTTGTSSPWPGVVLKAPDGRWDLSRRARLTVEIANPGDAKVVVRCRADNPGADGKKHCQTESIELGPGKSGTIDLALFPRLYAPRDQISFIGMRGDPPVSPELDPSNVTQLVVFVADPKRPHTFDIRRVVATGEQPPHARPAPDRFFPMIDELGQYLHKEWPGKVRSPGELLANREREARDLEEHPAPPDRTAYGGWRGGPELEATGFFRAEKYQGKWWLVDPEGRLFWSHGIDCVRSESPTPIADREHYFKDLPGPDSPFARFYGTGSRAPHGYYRDHAPFRTFDFARANLPRKYGDGWEQAFADITHRRLASWGLNTIANWSDSAIYLMRRTPYVATIDSPGRKIEGSEGYWGKFYDVFAPEFRENLRGRLAREKGVTAGDPWCIGFFVNNELSWGDELSLAIGTLRSPADQPAKAAFVADLEGRYGTIDKLNAAWGTSHASWDALRSSTAEPDREKAREDLAAFSTRIAETYFATVRDAVREVAPRQLYLGCRFAWVNDLAARAGARFCDIVSYNRYTHGVEDLKLPGDIDKPLVIGEFHFGALDRGLFHTGLVKARDQQHRSELYDAYVRGALRNPRIVGTHWFQFKDQATTGRFDGENYQIGFLDIADTPYPEIIEASRQIGRDMYEYRFRQGQAGRRGRAGR